MKNLIADDIELEEGKQYGGTIFSFDPHVGLGEIIVHNKGLLTNQKLPFHCVNIADGSRNINVDQRVFFTVSWHPRGRFEAINIENDEFPVYQP